jgi:hypothetical protein
MSDELFANLPRKAAELGTPLAHYRNRPALSLFVTLVRFCTRLIFAVVFIGLGLRAYGDPADNPGLGSVALLILGLLAGFLCLLSAAFLVRRGRRDGNVRGVVSCPGGLVCVLPDKSLVVPWDEIESIWDAGRRFRVRGGAEVILPDTLEGVPTLAEAFYRETFQRMTICGSAVILGGRAVEFGPIKLTRDAIAAGDKEVAWSEVGRIVLAWGRLRVFRNEETQPALDVPLREVPNVHALWALIERLREGGFGSIVIGPGASQPDESE